MLTRSEGEEDVFFNFIAISGEGYRTLTAGTPVQFELVEGSFGSTSRNIQTQMD